MLEVRPRSRKGGREAHQTASQSGLRSGKERSRSFHAWVACEGASVTAVIQNLLADMLASGAVKAILAPLKEADQGSPLPGLVADPARLELVSPFTPCMPISIARMASLLSKGQQASSGDQTGPSRIAVVMRPCEFRAAVELAKLQQLDISRLFTIGIDCVGTYEWELWEAVFQELGPPGIDRYVNRMRRAEAEPDDGPEYRHACSICLTPSAWRADLSVHLIGVQETQGMLLEALEREVLEGLGLAPEADPSQHEQALADLREVRQARRESSLKRVTRELGARQGGRLGIVKALERCQRCLNCTVACPLCYCRECLYRTATMEYEPRRYLGWARRKGAARLPGDVLAFHLTRLAHISTSCVGCGLCTSACPSGIGLDSIFQAVGQRTQALFDYLPGWDPDERLPVSEFREDEFETVGEEEH